MAWRGESPRCRWYQQLQSKIQVPNVRRNFATFSASRILTAKRTHGPIKFQQLNFRNTMKNILRQKVATCVPTRHHAKASCHLSAATSLKLVPSFAEKHHIGPLFDSTTLQKYVTVQLYAIWKNKTNNSSSSSSSSGSGGTNSILPPGQRKI